MFPIKRWIIKLGNLGFVSKLEWIGFSQSFDSIYEHEIDKGIAKVIGTASPQDEKEIKRVVELLKGTLIEV